MSQIIQGEYNNLWLCNDLQSGLAKMGWVPALEPLHCMSLVCLAFYRCAVVPMPLHCHSQKEVYKTHSRSLVIVRYKYSASLPSEKFPELNYCMCTTCIITLHGLYSANYCTFKQVLCWYSQMSCSSQLQLAIHIHYRFQLCQELLMCFLSREI